VEFSFLIARHYSSLNVPFRALIGTNIFVSVIEPSPGDEATFNPTFPRAFQRSSVLRPVIPPGEFSANLTGGGANFRPVKTREVRGEHPEFLFFHGLMTSPTSGWTKVSTTMLIQAIGLMQKRSNKSLLNG
jgi:hypothetical protein